MIEDYPYLDDPLPVQYVHWLGDILTGDWGYSYITSQSTHRRCSSSACRRPCSSPCGPIFIGLAHRHPARRVQRLQARLGCSTRPASTGSFGLISLPGIVIAVLMLFLVVTRIDFFPSVGKSEYVAPWDNPIEHFQNFFIPAFVLGTRHRRHLESPAAGRR